MSAREDTSLAPTLLLSMPQMQDENFERTVVLLCDHTAEGAFGLILNRPTTTAAAEAVAFDPPIKAHRGPLLWTGGPVEPERGWILLGETVDEESQTEIAPGLFLSTSIDLLRRVARPHDAVEGTVPGLAGMHDVNDHPDAQCVPGLLVYRYDSPLFFANAEDFRHRALTAVEEADQPVSWLLLNMEANVEVDLTALDALEDLRDTLADRGVLVALARVKQDLREDLDAFGLTERIGPEHVYPTMPTAVASYVRDFTARHGRPPLGAPTPT